MTDQPEVGTIRAKFLFTIGLFFLSAITAFSARAESVRITSETVVHRISLAAQQKVLAEEMFGALCYARAGVAKTALTARVDEAALRFRRVHTGLISGDRKLNLFTEYDSQVFNQWLYVDHAWSGLSGTYERMQKGRLITKARFEQTQRLSNVISQQSETFAAQIHTAYAPALSPLDGWRTNRISRLSNLRYLAAKLSRELCQVAHNAAAPGGMAFALADLDIEHQSVLGDPSANTSDHRFNTADTPHLDEADQVWQRLKPSLRNILRDQPVSDDEREILRIGLDHYSVSLAHATDRLMGAPEFKMSVASEAGPVLEHK